MTATSLLPTTAVPLPRSQVYAIGLLPQRLAGGPSVSQSTAADTARALRSHCPGLVRPASGTASLGVTTAL